MKKSREVSLIWLLAVVFLFMLLAFPFIGGGLTGRAILDETVNLSKSGQMLLWGIVALVIAVIGIAVWKSR